MFQPVGGMDMIGKAFAREVGDLIRYDAKVTRIRQDEDGVTVTYVDATAPATPQQAKADWCVCTIPLSILSQIPIDVGAPHEGRDRRRALCVGDQDRPAVQAPVLGGGRGDLWRHQLHRSADPPDRLSQHRLQSRRPRRAARRLYVRGLERVRIHRRCRRRNGSRARSNWARASIRNIAAEFENGIAVAWHRVPSTLGCAGNWTEETRAEHYDDLCQIDGRIVLAGEHASYIPAWQEGAILSSLDAITRLHERVVKT